MKLWYVSQYHNLNHDMIVAAATEKEAQNIYSHATNNCPLGTVIASPSGAPLVGTAAGIVFQVPKLLHSTSSLPAHALHDDSDQPDLTG